MPDRHGQQITSLGAHYIASAVAVTFAATIVVALRFWARIHQAKKYHSQKLAIDDWLTVAGLFLLYAMTFTSITFVLVGAVGWPGSHLSDKQKSNFYIVFFVYQMLYALASPVIKLSVVLYYKRLFDLPRFRLVSNIVAVTCILWGASVILVTIFECSDIRGAVNYRIRSTTSCINYYVYFQIQSITNVLLDTIILLMPVPLVWKLNLDLDRKLFVTAIFLLGGFVVIASMMRVIYFAQVQNKDPYKTLGQAALWTMIEPGMGVISACLPPLRPLYSLCFHRMMSIPGTVRTSISNRGGGGSISCPGIPDSLEQRKKFSFSSMLKFQRNSDSRQSMIQVQPSSLSAWKRHNFRPRDESLFGNRTVTFAGLTHSSGSSDMHRQTSVSNSSIDPFDSREVVS